MAIYSEFSHEKWWFSIVMWQFTGGYLHFLSLPEISISSAFRLRPAYTQCFYHVLRDEAAASNGPKLLLLAGEAAIAEARQIYMYMYDHWWCICRTYIINIDTYYVNVYVCIYIYTYIHIYYYIYIWISPYSPYVCLLGRWVILSRRSIPGLKSSAFHGIKYIQCVSSSRVRTVHWIGLREHFFFRKPLCLMVKTMVSWFSLKPIQWTVAFRWA